jgi:hypothetical protein
LPVENGKRLRIDLEHDVAAALPLDVLQGGQAGVGQPALDREHRPHLGRTDASCLMQMFHARDRCCMLTLLSGRSGRL